MIREDKVARAERESKARNYSIRTIIFTAGTLSIELDGNVLLMSAEERTLLDKLLQLIESFGGVKDGHRD